MATNQAILIRLMLSKSLLLKAKAEVTNSNDDVALATALLHLHDSVDNLLGAVTSHLSLTISKNKSYLLQVFDLIDTSGKQSLSYKNELQQLNTMRNSVKHHGILPNAAQVIALVPLVTKFCNKTSKKCFGIKLEDISLSALITKPENKKIVEEIEQLIDSKDYKNAMERAAIGLFKVFDSHQWTFNELGFATRGQNPKDVKNIFPEDSVDKVHLDLVEYGIDPYLYHRFGNLTPEVGYDNLEDKNIILRHNSLWWHKENWTRENALFCLQFLSNLILKQQRGYGGYTITNRSTSHTITFNKDSHIFSDKKGTVSRAVKKGETLEGGLDGYVNSAWEAYAKGSDEIYASMLLSYIGGKLEYVGYFLKKADIDISTEEYFEKMSY